MAIKALYQIIMLLFALLILILFAGVFKDFLFKFGNPLGIELAGSTQSQLTEKPGVSVICQQYSSTDTGGNDYNFYDYDVRLNNIKIELAGEEKPRTAALFFKNRVAVSYNTEAATIPGTVDKLFFKIQEAAEAPKAGNEKEFYVLGFFEPDEACNRLGNPWTGTPSPIKDEFIAECASKFVTAVSFASEGVSCSSGGNLDFKCELLKDDADRCWKAPGCWYKPGSCEECPRADKCEDSRIQSANRCKCYPGCVWHSFTRGCFPCAKDTTCNELSEGECKINTCGLNCEWNADRNICEQQ